MKNKIDDLRNHLFTQLERLNDDEEMKDQKKLEQEIERAKAIADIGQVLVNSAKVEVDFIRATDMNNGTGFFPDLASKQPPKQIG